MSPTIVAGKEPGKKKRTKQSKGSKKVGRAEQLDNSPKKDTNPTTCTSSSKMPEDKKTTQGPDDADFVARASKFVKTMDGLLGEKVDIADRVLGNSDSINTSMMLLKSCLHKGDKADAAVVRVAMVWALQALYAMQGRDADAKLAGEHIQNIRSTDGKKMHDAESGTGDQDGRDKDQGSGAGDTLA